MGMENPVAFKLVILLTSVWWLVFSIPFLKNVHQVHYVEAKKGLLRSTFRNLWATAKDIFTHKRVFLFIIAYFFYIDGVNTIISVSTSYGTTLGLDTVGMILALLVTQVVAMPFSILFGKLAGKVGSINLLCGAVGIYFVITVVGFFMGFNIEQNPGSESALALSQGLFWCMAFLVGTVQGGIQALSRSYFGKLVPADRSNEYFGFFDIFGKFAAVILGLSAWPSCSSSARPFCWQAGSGCSARRSRDKKRNRQEKGRPKGRLWFVKRASMGESSRRNGACGPCLLVLLFSR